MPANLSTPSDLAGYLTRFCLPLADNHRHQVELLSKKAKADKDVQVAVPPEAPLQQPV
jgi:hypothetical protein